MLSPSTLCRYGVVLGAFILVGCESGTEIAGVAAATAQRDPDGFVTVTATLGCELVYGMHRASGCDADDEEACVVAEWYSATDTNFANVLFESRQCREIGRVEGAIISVRSPGPVPADQPLKIRVFPSPELDARDDRPTIITIDSPP